MVQTHQSAVAVCVSPGARRVDVVHRDAAIVLRDARHLGIVADEIADLACESLADHVHAADRLEHGGLEIVVGEILQIAPDTRLQNVRERDGIARHRHRGEPAAGRGGIAAGFGGEQIGFVTVVAVECAPGAQRLQQDFLILLGDGFVEPALFGGLRQQLGDLALEIRLHAADTLRRAVEGACGVQIGVVIELDEGFQRDIEPPAIIEQRTMMIGNPPRAGIDVEPVLEFAFLGEAAELGEAIAAAQGPVAAARARVVFEQLHLVAGVTQFQRRGHAGEARAEDQHGSALRVAFQLDRALVAGLRRKAEAGHGVIHRSTARHRPDQRKQIAPSHPCRFVLHVIDIAAPGRARNSIFPHTVY